MPNFDSFLNAPPINLCLIFIASIHENLGTLLNMTISLVSNFIIYLYTMSKKYIKKESRIFFWLLIRSNKKIGNFLINKNNTQIVYLDAHNIVY